MYYRLDDYIDGDVAYLLGLIIARGTISEIQGIRQLTIEFPYSSLKISGINTSFDQDDAIKLGLLAIQKRLMELLDTHINIIEKDNSVDLVIRFMTNNLIWRDILLLTNKATSYPYFNIPAVFFDPNLPTDWKREFVRGYADVAGNIRLSNRYRDGRHRVRLDVLNYLTNWEVPVQLCTLLQEYLEVPVQLITWGHPNMNRKFREHQINIFAKPFLQIGFTFKHKQKILEELAQWNAENTREPAYKLCPGMRRRSEGKPPDPDENNLEKLDPRLVGNHYNAYWQICKALGCKRMPASPDQLTLEAIDDSASNLLESDENGE